MKRGIILSFCLICCLLTYAQQQKLRVAVAVQADTVFTLLGSWDTKTFDINLSKNIVGYIQEMMDTTLFELHQEEFPMMEDDKVQTGLPKNYLLKLWFKKLRKKQGYDMVVFIFKPEIGSKKYDYMNGFSYGMTTSDNTIFSLNDAMIFDTRDASELAHVNLYSDSEFMTRLNPDDQIRKLSVDYTQADVAKARILVDELNKAFALRVCQSLWIVRKKLDSKP